MRNLVEVDDFGAIDADNDSLLLTSFEDHEAFLKARARERYLIVGRKGSGKTAIFKKMLTIREPSYFSFGHTFSDYPWHHHNLQARIGIPDFDKFTHSWKYLILMTASKLILNHDNSLPHSEASMEEMIRIERFVIDTYGTRDPDVTQIFTPSKTLKLKPHFNLDFKILKAGVSPESVPMEELPTIVQELNANLSNAMFKCLNPANEYFICFDQLDLGFDPVGPQYTDRLIGLLLAARDLNIRARDEGRQFFVAVFLRDDIYDLLHFEDKNKVTENFVSLIEWDTSRTDKTLKQLMERRFTAVLADSEDEIIRWEDLFDEEKEMPGRQTKYRHILDRTYLRPRDIIKFGNTILDRYKSRVRAGNGAVSKKIANVDINSSRSVYSDYLMNELDDEIHKHIPHYKNYIELLRLIGKWQFSREEFDSKYRSGSTLVEGADPLMALKDLYAFSVVGFYMPGGRGYGGSEYVFKYKEPRARFDTTAQRFRVHPGLIEVLGLKRTR